ncbi:MAG: MCP four helix bundle domain-containing protein [Acidobacteriota bacterium]|nr:MCP four helix bundle domain-containing protein [Acidobacteriota bacterium]
MPTNPTDAAGASPQASLDPRRLVTTRTALILGFGVLLLLLALSGINTIQVVSHLRSSDENTLSQFLVQSRQLEEIRSAVYLSGTYIRDYLLEPDPARAEQSRLALLRTEQDILTTLSSRDVPAGPEDRQLWDALKQEMQDYWRAIDPVLAWNPGRRREQGYAFLRDHVLPLRAGTLSVAARIAAVNRQDLVRQDSRVIEIFTGLQTRSILALAGMLLLGFVQASAATFHILRLERQAGAHLKEVTVARQKLRELSAKLVETQESERKTISRDLHDAVGQSLSAVQLELHDLAAALASYPEPLRARVDRIRELVSGSVTMVRNVALLLRPSMLDDLGLQAALEWQAHQVARSTDLRIDVAADELPRELPDEHKTCIFRLVQEALNNVCRHANANHVAIGLEAGDSQVTVTVRDDGRGFVPGRSNGLGLIGMKERVDGLGGRLHIESSPGKGTLLEASLPLPSRFAGN